MAGSVNKAHLPMIEHKPCRSCGADFYKNPRDSYSQWSERSFCSVSCGTSYSLEPLHERYWKYANVQQNNMCWNWLGPKTTGGYGVLGYLDKSLKAHRVGYELRYGLIGGGLYVCHTCDNPSCVNPNHLFLGTARDNARDASRKGRLNPKSLLNLRPGQKGKVGAGDKSNMEILNNE